MEIPVIRGRKHPEGSPRPSLVLLHAFPLDHLLFDSIRPPEGWRLFTPDFPGFGDSSRFPGEPSMEAAARGILAHLEAEGAVFPVVVGGVSMGGYLALEFARLHPERTAGLLLTSTRLSADDAEGREKRRKTAEAVRQEGTAALARTLAEALLGEGTRRTRPDLLRVVRRTIEEADPEAVAQASLAMAGRRDQTDFAGRFDRPVVWIAGEEDGLFSAADQEVQARRFPRGRFVRISSCGHLPPWEKPLEFQELADDFVKEVHERGV